MMGTFKTNCAHCGTRVEVDDAYAGARTQCPGCGRMMDLIPEPVPPPPPPQDPDPDPEENSGGGFAPTAGNGGYGRNYDDGSRPEGHADVEAAIDRLGERLAGPRNVSFFTKLADFLCFRRMIVPGLVIALGAVSLVICVIAAIVMLCRGEFLWGLGLLFGWLALRMSYEFFMVLFSINDTLTTIKNQNLRK